MFKGRYSIKDLEKITGIKAHTIRIWEQRYGLLSPLRTDTNIRYYDDDDLQFILNVSVLNKNGYKISRIADLDRLHVMQEVRKITKQTDDKENQISLLVMSMLSLDEDAFNRVIENDAKRVGFESMVTNLIYPFLEHIGNLWLTGAIRPAHEHFISNLIRQKIIAATDAVSRSIYISDKRFMLFTPDKEIHEISLLFSQYILRSVGFKTYYLGLSTPFADLEAIVEEVSPDYLLTVVTSHPSGDALLEYIDKLICQFPGKSIIISGLQVRKISHLIPKEIFVFTDIQQFVEYLNIMSK
jgi:MerR family transcriptional regulator, light-induced transcriptional regulator